MIPLTVVEPLLVIFQLLPLPVMVTSTAMVGPYPFLLPDKYKRDSLGGLQSAKENRGFGELTEAQGCKERNKEHLRHGQDTSGIGDCHVNSRLRR